MALSVLPTWYDVGTASVTNGSATVSGQGVSWGDDAIMPGDFLWLPSQPLIPPIRIDAATDDTLTLAAPWPGTTAALAAYEIQYTGIIERSTAQTREVLEDLSVLRANTRGLFYSFIGNTADTDPGDGNIAVDNANPSLVTEIYASDIDANRTGRDVSPLIELWAAGTVLIFRSFATTAYVAYQITEVEQEADYYRAIVSFVGSSGSLINEPISVEWVITGEGIEVNAAGTFAQRPTYDTEPAGFMYLSTNGNGSDNLTPSLYRKNSATSGDWSAQIPFQGPMGYRGWSPIFSYEERSGGTIVVARLTDWVGGEGSKPTAGIGQYVGTTGLVVDPVNAVNVKGIRGDAMGIRLTMHMAVNTDAPSPGFFRTNNTTFGSITELRFPLTPVDLSGASIASWLLTLDDVLNGVSRGTLRFQSVTDPAGYMEFRIAGPITSQPNYYAIPVTPITGVRPAVATTYAAYFAASGADGTNGTNGADGSDPGALYNWNDGTADANPGAGNVRANTADVSTATFIYASKTGRSGDNLAVWLAGLAASTNTVKGGLTLTRSDGNAQVMFDVLGVTDAVGYVKISVANPSGASGFIAGTAISLQFNRSGDQGTSDAISLAASINAATEISSAPDPQTMFAVTDPLTGDLLARVSLATLATAIQPPSGVVDNKTANYTVVVGDRNKTITVDATAAARTITIDPIANFVNGDTFTIKKIDSSNNIVTIDANASETIDGALTAVLRRQYQTITLKSNGTAWIVVAAAKEQGDLGFLAGFRNKLINGNFDFWQRSTSAQTSSGYGSDDRWNNQNTGSTKSHSRQAFTPGQTDVPGEPAWFSRTVITSVAGASNYVLKYQAIEGIRTLAGKRWTVTLYAKAAANRNIAINFRQNFGSGGSPSGNVDVPTGLRALTTNWQKISFTVDIPSITGKVIGTAGNDMTILEIWMDAGSSFAARASGLGQSSGTVDIAHISMVEGDATAETDPFAARFVGDELALCQRYYQVALGNRYCSPYARSAFANSGGFRWQMTTPMRGTPSFSYGSITNGTHGSIIDPEVDGALFNATGGTGSNMFYTNFFADAEF